ncbi:hypothetical protein D046_3062B, partial [Vibrio parahaemolyticus V-223/04]
CQCNKR